MRPRRASRDRPAADLRPSRLASDGAGNGGRRTTAALLALAILLLAYPALRLFWDFEIDSNEGWNAYFQLRALAGEGLYSLPSPLFFNNYPPLSFYIVGGLSLLVGDPVLAGRLVSLFAVIAIAAGCAAVVRAGTEDRTAARLAAATCLGFFAVFATDYVGMNDPQLLGQALLLAGLVLHVRRPAGATSGLAVAALFGAGLLVKHNILAIPLIVTGSVLRQSARGHQVGFVGGGLVLAGAAFAAVRVLGGPDAIGQILAPRTYDAARAFLMTTEMLGRLDAALVAVGFGLIAARGGRLAGLVTTYLSISLAQGAIFSGGTNTDINVYFDLFIALSIGAGLGLHHLQRWSGAPLARVGFALVVNAGVLMGTPLALGRFAVDIGGEMTLRQTLFRADVAYLKALPEPALCQSFLLCVRAGKALIVDPFNTNMRVAFGHLPQDTVARKLLGREFAVLQIADTPEHGTGDYPGVQSMPQRFVHFSDEEFAVIARSYRLDRVGVSGRFYRPAPGP